MSRQQRISVPLPAPARRLSTAPTPPSASSQLQETPDPDINDNVSQPSAEELLAAWNQQQQIQSQARQPWFDTAHYVLDERERQLAALTAFGVSSLKRHAKKDRFGVFLKKLEGTGELKRHILVMRFIILWDMRTNDAAGTTRGVSKVLFPATLRRLSVLAGVADLSDLVAVEDLFGVSTVRAWYNDVVNNHRSNYVTKGTALERMTRDLDSSSDFEAERAAFGALCKRGDLLETRDGVVRIREFIPAGVVLALKAIAFTLFDCVAPTYGFKSCVDMFKPAETTVRADHDNWSWPGTHEDDLVDEPPRPAYETSMRPVLLMRDAKQNIHRICGERDGLAFKLIETIFVHRVCQLAPAPVCDTPMWRNFVAESSRKDVNFHCDFRGCHAVAVADAQTAAESAAFDLDFGEPVPITSTSAETASTSSNNNSSSSIGGGSGGGESSNNKRPRRDK
jgi:hypothetical protein